MIFPALLSLLQICGCRTVAPLPPADLAAPGWQVRHAQAVWKPNASAPELTGELLYAIHAGGETFLQFTKNPFPIVTARTSANSWQIEFAQAGRTYSGAGHPPKRLLWFCSPLTRIPSATFSLTQADDHHWRLESKATGETLEAVITP